MKHSTGNRIPIQITADTTDRILARLSPPADTGCREWQGSRIPRGYGRISVQNEVIYTHRYMATLEYGPIPDDMVVDHLCRNTSCCEPSHLEIVTPRVNAVERAVGRVESYTHCRNGHSYTKANTGRRANGSRRCLECRRVWLRRRR